MIDAISFDLNIESGVSISVEHWDDTMGIGFDGVIGLGLSVVLCTVVDGNFTGESV